MPADAFDIGWWIESIDEDVYGPVSRQTLQSYLADGVISTNTLVRHCTQTSFCPVADAPGMTAGLSLDSRALATGDRLADTWPSRTRDRMALAEAGIECYRHSRPAVLVCVRCQAPYCNKCRAKPFRGQFYCCKRCQAGVHNRRFGALLVDAAIFNYLPILMVVPFIGSQAGVSLTYLAQGAGGILFLIRDAMFRGAGPGKRVTSLRVVQVQDGVTPLTYGQGVIRWLSQLIPIFNLIDAFAPARDPLQRRYGDRWAKTRVIDTARKLEKDREKAKHRMAKKGIELVLQSGMTMEQFARIAE